MKLNPSMSKELIGNRSRTHLPAHPNLSINGALIDQVDQLKLLGVTLDSKLAFEDHLRNRSRSISQKLGILLKSKKIQMFLLLYLILNTALLYGMNEFMRFSTEAERRSQKTIQHNKKKRMYE